MVISSHAKKERGGSLRTDHHGLPQSIQLTHERNVLCLVQSEGFVLDSQNVVQVQQALGIRSLSLVKLSPLFF